MLWIDAPQNNKNELRFMNAICENEVHFESCRLISNTAK